MSRLKITLPGETNEQLHLPRSNINKPSPQNLEIRFQIFATALPCYLSVLTANIPPSTATLEIELSF
jgi:hypothetical protein